ncbi:MAG: c-type cytochrome [Pseudomonadota bacterium]
MSNRFTQKTFRFFVSLLAVFFFITGCSQSDGYDFDLSGFDLAKGEQVYNNLCMVCHTPGMFGAPKIGNRSMWASRFARGMDSLINHSINGFNAMPPKGGNATLSDEEVKNAVAFMVSKSQ